MTPDNETQDEASNMPVGGVEKTKQKFTKTEKGNEIVHDMDIDEVNKYIKDNNLDINRFEYWTSKASELLAINGSDFDVFVEKHKILVEKGDQLLKDVETTGFNIDRFDIFTDSDFFEEGNKISIYYNNQIDRPEHFGLLLAKMENEGLLDKVDIKLNCKATKVEWEWDETSETIRKETVVRSDGSEREIGKSIEVVVKFSLDYEQGIVVLAFFQKHIFLEREGAMPGSWQIPDIRILPDLLRLQMSNNGTPDPDLSLSYISVINNSHQSNNGKLIILNVDNAFENKKSGWKSNTIMINKEMADFIHVDEFPE